MESSQPVRAIPEGAPGCRTGQPSRHRAATLFPSTHSTPPQWKDIVTILDESSPIEEVAGAVSVALTAAGITAVLSGGAALRARVPPLYARISGVAAGRGAAIDPRMDNATGRRIKPPDSDTDTVRDGSSICVLSPARSAGVGPGSRRCKSAGRGSWRNPALVRRRRPGSAAAGIRARAGIGRIADVRLRHRVSMVQFRSSFNSATVQA
jgi:hypothetical protein